jgi:hypothetical protein
MARIANDCLESIKDNEDREFIRKIACDHSALPRDEALDRVLRSEAATEGSLSRSLDRLERLKRSRKGESVPLPLRINLA